MVFDTAAKGSKELYHLAMDMIRYGLEVTDNYALSTEELLKMWSRVKGDSASAWTYILICLVFAGLIAAVIMKYTKKRYRRRRYAMRRRKR